MWWITPKRWVGSSGLAARALEVLGQRRQPRLREALVDDVQQRPHRSLRQPRVRGRARSRRGRHRAEDQPAREREVDVRADAVRAARRRPEPRRESLGQPPLDPARRDGDDLRRERILERLQQRLGEAARRGRSATLGSVDVEHFRDPRSRLEGAHSGRALHHRVRLTRPVQSRQDDRDQVDSRADPRPGTAGAFRRRERRAGAPSPPVPEACTARQSGPDAEACRALHEEHA